MAVEQQHEEGVVRISFGWIFGTGVVVIGLSLLGGVVGSRLWPGQSSLSLENDGERLVSTIQEVNISPSKAAVEVVEGVQRSVVLLSRGTAEQAVATGTVVTNDGLIVTAADLAEGSLTAYDWQGQELPLDFVGKDELFGLTYLRATNAVLPTIDLRDEDVRPAYQLLSIARNETSLQPRSSLFTVVEAVLPPEISPRGVQRMLQGVASADFLPGSPLVDEESKLSGILVQPNVGLALPADLLRASLNRVTNGRRELNPLAELGLNVRYDFARLNERGKVGFVAEITSVARGGRAEAVKVERGDLVRRVNDIEVVWEDSLVEVLTAQEDITLVLQRGNEELEVRLPK